jgi:hypothetical protein
MRTIDHPEIESATIPVSDNIAGTPFSPEPDSRRDAAAGSEFEKELVYDLRSDRFYTDLATFRRKSDGSDSLHTAIRL